MWHKLCNMYYAACMHIYPNNLPVRNYLQCFQTFLQCGGLSDSAVFVMKISENNLIFLRDRTILKLIQLTLSVSDPFSPRSGKSALAHRDGSGIRSGNMTALLRLQVWIGALGNEACSLPPPMCVSGWPPCVPTQQLGNKIPVAWTATCVATGALGLGVT